MRIIPKGASVYGIDLGKNSFHIVGMDNAGTPIQRAHLSRKTIFKFFMRADKALIGMEACPGSQWLARKLQEIGAYCQNYTGSVCEAIREVQQKRYY